MFRNPTDEQDGQGHRVATYQKPGKQNNFNTAKSNYVWLPIRFENDMPIIDWYSEWRIEDYEKNQHNPSPNSIEIRIE